MGAERDSEALVGEGTSMYNKHLDAFMAVAETGSFSRAAESCHISRTALMQQINLLEGHLGFPLFVRSNRGAELTPMGRLVHARARKIMQISADTITECLAMQNSSQIRVGILPNLPLTMLGPICLAYQSTYPTSSVVFVERNVENYLSSFLNNEFDVTADYMSRLSSNREDLRFAELARDHFDVAVPSNSPLAHRSVVEPEDLDGRTVALLVKGVAEAEDQLREFMARRVPGARIMDIESYSKAVPLTCALRGRMLFHYHLNDGEYGPLVSKRFDADGLTISLGMCYRSHARQEVLGFVHFAETYCERHYRSRL